MIFIVSQAVSYVVTAIPALYFNVLELGGMRGVEDPMMMLFFAHPWILGFAMAIAFQKFRGSFKSTGWCKGKAFGLYVWLLAGLPSAFLVYTSMDYPMGFHVSSVLGSLLYMMAAGIVLEKVSA